MLPETLRQWLDTATAQLRCRRAAPAVREELESHLAEQYHALRQAGEPEKQAARKTVQSMGDAVQVGVSLDAVHRPRPAWGLAAVLAVIMVLARLLWLCTGVEMPLITLVPAVAVLAVAVQWGDVSRLARHGTALYGIYSICLIVFASWPGAYTVSGRVQHAEALCMLLVPLYALAVYAWKGRGLLGLLACCALLLPGVSACLFMPLMAGVIQLCLAALALGIYCCAKDWFGCGKKRSFACLFLVVLGLAGGAAIFLWTKGIGFSAYEKRVFALFHPMADPHGAGYFPLLLRDVWQGGDGLGASREQLASLLADFPMTYWFCRLGAGPMLLACGALLGCLAMLGMAALRIRNAAGRLLAISCAVLFPFQLLSNLLAGAGLLPYRLSLPFMGGAGTVCMQAAIAGLLLSAFRYDTMPAPPEEGAGKKRLHLSLEWR